MITVSENIISNYSEFVSGSVSGLLPIIGITAGVFLAFTIFDRVVRIIVKAIRK